MFSGEHQNNLPNHQLAEVICQLRFPEVSDLRSSLPSDFREAINSSFPVFTAGKDLRPPKLSGTPGNFHLENAPAITNFAFASSNGGYRINLTENFISLTCTQYTGWEDFAAMLDMPLAAFIRIYTPACFQRIGLRYMNFISRKRLSLEDVPFRELISPAFTGPLQLGIVPEQSFSRCSVDSDFPLKSGTRVKLHAGPGYVQRGPQKDPEMKFILDFDLYAAGRLLVDHCASILSNLHSQAYPLFRGAITQKLFDAMNNS